MYCVYDYHVQAPANLVISWFLSTMNIYIYIINGVYIQYVYIYTPYIYPLAIVIPYDPHFFMVRTDGPEATAPLMRRVKKKTLDAPGFFSAMFWQVLMCFFCIS